MENLNLRFDQVEGGQVIIREGDALPLKEPLALSITGDIHSVAIFIKNRRPASANQYQIIDPGQAVITVDKKASTITLRTHPNDVYGTTVTGVLEISDELKTFRVNDKKLLSQKEVIDILRFNRIYFRDADRHQEVLMAYQRFTYKTESDGHSNAKDRSGNHSSAISKSVTTNLPDNFVLKVPIFKGEAEKQFRVEICLDVTEGSAKFWFESEELVEIIQVEKEFIFNRELSECSDLLVINK